MTFNATRGGSDDDNNDDDDDDPVAADDLRALAARCRSKSRWFRVSQTTTPPLPSNFPSGDGARHIPCGDERRRPEADPLAARDPLEIYDGGATTVWRCVRDGLSALRASLPVSVISTNPPSPAKPSRLSSEPTTASGGCSGSRPFFVDGFAAVAAGDG